MCALEARRVESFVPSGRKQLEDWKGGCPCCLSFVAAVGVLSQTNGLLVELSLRTVADWTVAIIRAIAACIVYAYIFLSAVRTYTICFGYCICVIFRYNIIFLLLRSSSTPPALLEPVR